ncbi:MAG: glycosyltransferase family 4 protein [Novosphingobium sp.]
MKILVIASLAESLVNFRGPLLQALIAAGHEVHGAAPGLVPGTETGEKLKSMGIGLVDIPLTRAGLNPLADLRLGLMLWRQCRQERYDVVLAYTIKPVIWGMLASRAAGVPRRVALITGLGYAFTGKAAGRRAFVRSISVMLYRSALRQAHYIFFQNPDDRDHFASLDLLPPDAKISVVNGSGVDLEHFSQKPLPGGTFRFLLIARLLGDKGIREYVSAARSIRQDYDNVVFDLVGGTDPNPDAIPQDEVQGWHDSGDIRWLGHLSDVRSALADCHVYVLPSYREGTPRTVLEAMSTGRAIITTDAPGCRETVVDGVNGFLVPVREVEALASAMRQFLDCPSLAPGMGTQSHNIAEEKYDVHKVNADMIAQFLS